MNLFFKKGFGTELVPSFLILVLISEESIEDFISCDSDIILSFFINVFISSSFSFLLTTKFVILLNNSSSEISSKFNSLSKSKELLLKEEE